ncbi:hypothetical protein GCM10025874_16250 [Arenivirga flava]|uniref:Uncharacterized protein n=1 Tax=Arenivirga flava TaxID=1930060 RepID=A0AA37UTZ3_9MICO|nr:hypothetical protein GCM10025874_16250 [Arenivirga flava]
MIVTSAVSLAMPQRYRRRRTLPRIRSPRRSAPTRVDRHRVEGTAAAHPALPKSVYRPLDLGRRGASEDGRGASGSRRARGRDEEREARDERRPARSAGTLPDERTPPPNYD